MSSIAELISDFVSELAAAVESEAMGRARHAVEAALGGRAAPRSNGKAAGRPATMVADEPRAPGKARKARKKAPIQLCPVPGCSGRAAPIFGMVCAKHKGLPKATIKKYREARRAKKLQAKGGGAKARAARSGVKKTVAKRRKKIVRKTRLKPVIRRAPAPAAAPAAASPAS